jgi:fatty acid desaturase
LILNLIGASGIIGQIAVLTEHQLHMTIPSYNFQTMNRLIKERGFYQKGLFKNNYFQILKLAIKI